MATETEDSNRPVNDDEFLHMWDNDSWCQDLVRTLFTRDPDHSTPSADSLSVDSAPICRICQLTELESGKALEATGCKCRGSIQMCHRECIQHWIRTRVSNMCELCNSPMQYEVFYRLTSHTNNPHFNHAQRVRCPTNYICRDSRRAWFLVIFTILLTATCTAVVMTVYTRMEYNRIQSQSDGQSTTMSPTVNREYEYSMSISLSITVFCSTICISFGSIWMVWELVVSSKERCLVRDMQRWMRSFHPVDIPLQDLITGNVRERISDRTIETTAL